MIAGDLEQNKTKRKQTNLILGSVNQTTNRKWSVILSILNSQAATG